MKTTYLGLELRSPVVVASSPYTADAEEVARCVRHGAGAVVIKSIFEEQIVRQAAALAQASPDAGMGDAGEYLERYLGDEYLARHLRILTDARATGVPVIGSINCIAGSDGWADYAAAMQQAGASALELNIFLQPTDRHLTASELEHTYADTVRKVLAEGKSDLIKGFISQRTHKPFDAFLTLDVKKGNVKFEFPPRESSDRKTKGSKTKTEAQAEPAADLSKATRHGAIKVKGKGEYELLEAEDGWHVEGLTFGKNRKPLVIPHTMCEVAMSADIVAQLLTKGKSPLIKDFVSRKSGKKFEAYLVFSSTSGRISYEFPPRK